MTFTTSREPRRHLGPQNSESAPKNTPKNQFWEQFQKITFPPLMTCTTSQVPCRLQGPQKSESTPKNTPKHTFWENFQKITFPPLMTCTTSQVPRKLQRPQKSESAPKNFFLVHWKWFSKYFQTRISLHIKSSSIFHSALVLRSKTSQALKTSHAWKVRKTRDSLHSKSFQVPSNACQAPGALGKFWKQVEHESSRLAWFGRRQARLPSVENKSSMKAPWACPM